MTVRWMTLVLGLALLVACSGITSDRLITAKNWLQHFRGFVRREGVSTKEVPPASSWIADVSGAEQSVGGFREVYETSLNRLVRLAHLITGSNSAAEDVVHDVFVAAYRKWERIDDPYGYLYRAVVNRSRSLLRRRAIEWNHALRPSSVDLPPELDEVWIALSKIPVKRRTALVLRYYADLPVDAIAEAMGVRPATVRSLIHRGYMSMKRELNA